MVCRSDVLFARRVLLVFVARVFAVAPALVIPHACGLVYHSPCNVSGCAFCPVFLSGQVDHGWSYGGVFRLDRGRATNALITIIAGVW